MFGLGLGDSVFFASRHESDADTIYSIIYHTGQLHAIPLPFDCIIKRGHTTVS